MPRRERELRAGDTLVPPRPTGPSAAGSLRRGATVGRYVVLDRIGEGGIGEVYSAYDPELDRKVAVKLLLRGAGRARADDFEERLIREAQAMARVSHPNVLPIYDVGLAEGRVFLTMELVQGVTLRRWRRDAAPGFRDVLAAYIAAGRGLSAAHGAGVVHRDFKPDNVLVAEDGGVKVMDFGIARALNDGPEVRASSVVVRAASIPARASASSEAPDAAQASDCPPTVRLPSSFVMPGVEPPPRAPSASPPSEIEPTSGPASRASGSVRSSRPSSLSFPLTSEGVILGTPGYMAPEQYRSEPIDARTDQFSFCVALYEALYGERPFAGESPPDVMAAVLEGHVRPPPRGTRVPPWLRRVLVRGVSVDREARYPSMDALLQELSRDVGARTWRAVVVAAAVGLALAAVFGTQRYSAAQAGRACSGGDAIMSEVWNGARREEARRAFIATGRPFAVQAHHQASSALDTYASRWVEMHAQTCKATRVRGEQSEQTMGLRMACLEERRRDVAALAQLFASADAEVVEGAAQAARSLPALASCANSASLASITPLPEDAAARAQIDALRLELAALEAQVRSGAARGARDRALKLARRVDSLGYEPLAAETFAALGALHVGLGEFTEAASAYKRATWAAERAHADEAKLRAVLGVAFALGELGRFGEARDYVRLADAVGARLGRDATFETERLSTEGWISFREGSYADAVTVLRRAVGVATRVAEPNPVTLGLLYNRLASSLLHVRAYDEALTLLGKEDELIVAAEGEDHPARIHNLVDTSAVLIEARRFGDAASHVTEALAIAGRAGLRESPAAVFALNNLGEAEDGLGRPANALARFNDAIAIATKAYGDNHWVVGALRVNRARALLGLGRSRDAVRDAEDGLRIEEAMLPSGHDLLGRALATLGVAYVAECHSARAIPLLTRALALLDRQGSIDDIGRARFSLAKALWATGDRSPYTRRLGTEARDTFRSVDARKSADEANRWLSDPTTCRVRPP